MTFDEIVQGLVDTPTEGLDSRLYLLDELVAQSFLRDDAALTEALDQGVIGYVVYREDGVALPHGPYPGGERRAVKILFDGGPNDFSFEHTDAQGLTHAMEKEDLPLAILELAVRDGYASAAQLEAAQARPQLSEIESGPDSFDGPSSLDGPSFDDDLLL